MAEVLLNQKNILIIDDHDSIRLLLGTILSKKYSVTTKKDGIEGLAWLGMGNRPDLILLDMEMPRLGGAEFLRNLKNSGYFKDIPVIVVSGEESDENITQCFEMGAKDYMKKPFNPLKLKNTINSIFQPMEYMIN